MLAHEVIGALRDRGHEVHALVGRGSKLPQDGFTHGVIDIDLDRKADYFLGARQPSAWEHVEWHLFNYRTYRDVRSKLLEIKPDLVVVWNLWVASMAPLIAARRTGIPLVIHTADRWLYYGLKDWRPLVGTQNPRKRRIADFLQMRLQPILFSLARPKPIITISEFIRRVYIEAGFDGSAIEAIRLGVPLNVFNNSNRTSSQDGCIRFLYVGSLWEGKGAHFAIRALGILKGKPGLPKLELNFYGSGTSDFMNFLQEEIRVAGVEKIVRFHGFVDRLSLPDTFRKHDVLLFPSVWEEPFAAVPVEAMACGMAVIATTAGGTPEAIEDGRTGILVPPQDVHALSKAMERLILDDALRHRLGEEAAQVARERFDFNSYVDRLEKRYSELAGVSVHS